MADSCLLCVCCKNSSSSCEQKIQHSDSNQFNSHMSSERLRLGLTGMFHSTASKCNARCAQSLFGDMPMPTRSHSEKLGLREVRRLWIPHCLDFLRCPTLALLSGYCFQPSGLVTMSVPICRQALSDSTMQTHGQHQGAAC